MAYLLIRRTNIGTLIGTNAIQGFFSRLIGANNSTLYRYVDDPIIWVDVFGLKKNKRQKEAKQTHCSAGEGTGTTNKTFGQNGTQFESKTTWQNGKTERIDVENPNPGQRDGQIHYHEPDNTKWYLDVGNKVFYSQRTGENAPSKIQRLLKDKDVQNAIDKGLKFLGEDTIFK